MRPGSLTVSYESHIKNCWSNRFSSWLPKTSVTHTRGLDVLVRLAQGDRGFDGVWSQIRSWNLEGVLCDNNKRAATTILITMSSKRQSG